MSAACTVWFYSPAKDRVTGLNVVNKIVAGLDPPFCHVELQFPSGEACSIVMGGVVTLRQRTFDRDFYTPELVRAPQAAVGKALELARAHLVAKTSFGVLGGRTFCSKLVLDLLCESGMLEGNTPVRSLVETPSALFRILQQRQCVSQPLAAISFVDNKDGNDNKDRKDNKDGKDNKVYHKDHKLTNKSSSAVGFRFAPDKTQSQKDNVSEDMQLLLGAENI